MSLETLIVAAHVSLAVALAGFFRGLTGFGFALAAVPLLTCFISPAQAVVTVILLQCFVGPRDIVILRSEIDRKSLRRLTIGALLGTGPGIFLLTWFNQDVMRVLIALIVLGTLPVLMGPFRADRKPGNQLAFPAGIAAGFFAGLAAIPGPPAIAYFLHRGTSARETRASLLIFFFCTSLIALPGLWISGLISVENFAVSLGALPALVLSTALGGRLFKQVSEQGYRRFALGLLSIMALFTGLRGFFGLINGLVPL